MEFFSLKRSRSITSDVVPYWLSAKPVSLPTCLSIIYVNMYLLQKICLSAIYVDICTCLSEKPSLCYFFYVNLYLFLCETFLSIFYVNMCLSLCRTCLCVIYVFLIFFLPDLFFINKKDSAVFITTNNIIIFLRIQFRTSSNWQLVLAHHKYIIL